MPTLASLALDCGGSIRKLYLPDTKVVSQTNPSVAVCNGRLLTIIRGLNYVLWQASRFPCAWGPLAYMHPENDRTLTTTNYLAELDPTTLEVTRFTEIRTDALDELPLWQFIGKEDARLSWWNNQIWISGVRRDNNPTGIGRMETSRIEVDWDAFTAVEVERHLIPVPSGDSYCEKNWMPVADLPFHYVKWTQPTELVRANLDGTTESLSIVDTKIPVYADQRGSSQILQWEKYLIAITHEVDLFTHRNWARDAVYRHRLAVWDEDFQLVGLSKQNFSFMDGNIEFCAGAAELNGDLIISYGFQDNCAYALKLPGALVNSIIEEALC